MEPEEAAGQAVSAPGPNPRADFEAFLNDHYRYHLTVLMVVGASMEDADEAIRPPRDMLKKNTWGRLTSNPKAWVRKAVLHAYYDQQKRDGANWRSRTRRRRRGATWMTARTSGRTGSGWRRCSARCHLPSAQSLS